MVIVSDDHHYYKRNDLRSMNMLRHPVWVFDIDNKSMFWANRAALEVWNATTMESLLERDFATDMSIGVETWLKNFKENQIANNDFSIEKWTFYPKGVKRTLDVTCSAIRIDDGRTAMLVESELLDNQAAIANITARSIEVLKHLPIAVSQFTMDGKLMFQNPNASTTFGEPAKESNSNEEKNNKRHRDKETGLSDNPASDDSSSNDTIQDDNTLLHRFVDMELGKIALSKVLNDETFSAETQQVTKIQLNEGDELSESLPSFRWFHIILRKARDPVTSEFVILYIARDITDIVKARKDSNRAAMKSEFLDVMAHEIRTPLHQIIGYSDLLEDSKLDDEQLTCLVQIKSSCSLLMAIINDLLDCSKLEHGQLQIEHISFKLDVVVEGCAASIGPQIQSKGLTLKRSIDPECPRRVKSDPNRLRQILQNLLSNAVKFTNSGTIELVVKPVAKSDKLLGTCEGTDCTDCGQQWLRFEVTDSGIGMTEKEQTVVFERYQQANASVSRNYGGTGLGLPICKGLVELLGGIIGLRSEYGKGTTVYFEVPFAVIRNDSSRILSRLNSASDDDVSVQPRESVSMSVLIVEDNKINQKVVKAMLERMGHSTTVAENGEIALSKMKQQQFHVILMDIQMPVMDGIECTKYIRNVLHLSKIEMPILGLTAGYQNSDREYYEKEVGMNGCLGKPLPMESLKRAIAPFQPV